MDVSLAQEDLTKVGTSGHRDSWRDIHIVSFSLPMSLRQPLHYSLTAKQNVLYKGFVYFLTYIVKSRISKKVGWMLDKLANFKICQMCNKFCSHGAQSF